MDAGLSLLLPEFKNLTYDIRRGVTHTTVRIMGDSVKAKKSGFVADVYILRRTREISVSRIDTKDEKTLRLISGFLSRFKLEPI
jgi:hypothetical protein